MTASTKRRNPPKLPESETGLGLRQNRKPTSFPDTHKKNPRSDLLDGGEGGCEGHTRWRDAISITYGVISLQGIHRLNELLVGLGCLQAIYRFALAFLLGHRSLRKRSHVFALEPLVYPFSL